MTQEFDRQAAGVESVPAEVWLRAGDTLAGFVPSEGFNCTSLRVLRGDHWDSVLAEPPSWDALRGRPAFYGSPLLGPYVYGLPEGLLEYGGQAHAIRPGREKRANHGIARDYPWIVTDTRQSEEEAILRAHLAIGGGETASDARLPEYPYPLDMEATYILRPRELAVYFRVTNLGTGISPLGMGIHPYFALPMREGGSTADLVARGCMARLTEGARYQANAGLGGYKGNTQAFSQRMDRYIALASPERSILDIFERADQASDLEGEAEPFWFLSDGAAGLEVSIKASGAFRFVGQFVPGDRSVLSPVVSTNRPDGFGVAARGGDGGLIELAAGETWRGWCTLSVGDLAS